MVLSPIWGWFYTHDQAALLPHIVCCTMGGGANIKYGMWSNALTARLGWMGALGAEVH